MLDKTQSKAIRKQIIDQITNTFPEDKKAFAINQIQTMQDDQLVEFLKQNKMIQTPEETTKSTKQQTPTPTPCIFCTISSGQVPSYQIDDNKDNVAVLEINPISKGHSIIIPKKHIASASKLPQNSFSLAKKVAKKLKSKLKPIDVQIHSTNLFGHETINVLPVYKNETINSKRYQEGKNELVNLQKKLKKKITKPRKKKTKKQVQAPVIKETKVASMSLPRRIP